MIPIDAILNWFEVNGRWLSVLAVGSVFSFLATLVAIPAIVIHIPENYFLHEKRHPSYRHNALPGAKLLLAIVKNIFGIAFVLAGIAMLVLPGQGLLTILIGLMLVNFPGKYGLERKLIRQKSVLRSVNWIRAKAHRPPLRLPAEAATKRD
jgi:archaellum biogenesis protein FlaJ (TadC family)